MPQSLTIKIAAPPTPTSHKGVAAAVFLVIALLALVVGALTYLQRGNKTIGSEAARRTEVATILKQASDVKTGFDRMVLEAGIPAARVMLTTDSPDGLFDPVRKLAAKPLPPPGVFGTEPAQPYTYNRKVALPQVGAATRYDFSMTLGGITRETCVVINNILYKDGLSTAPAVSGLPLAAWAGATETIVDESSATTARFAGRPEGCIQTSDARFVYFKALAEDGASTSETLPIGSGSSVTVPTTPPPEEIPNGGPPPIISTPDPGDGSGPEF